MAIDYTPNRDREHALMTLSQRLAKHGLSPMTCFIIYCWSETMKPFAAQLRYDLDKAGVNVIFDMTHNGCGTHIEGFIQSIKTVDRVVVCCTPELKRRYEVPLSKREGVVSDELDLVVNCLGEEADLASVCANEERSSSKDSFENKSTYASKIFPIWCESEEFEAAVPVALRVFGKPVCLSFNAQASNGKSRSYDEALWDLLKALYRTGQQPHLIPAFDLTWQEWQAQLAKGEQPVSYWAAENFPQHMDDWVERGAEVALLKQAFEARKGNSSTTKTSSRRVLCTGAGGVGKTVLAIHYAYECVAYQSIIWLRGETRETYLEDWVAYGQAHQLTTAEQTTPLAQAKAITKALSKKTGYLVVIDNVDTEAVADAVGQTLPTHGGDVLITGRYKNIANISQTIDIDAMRVAEGCELLRQFVPEAETETLKALGEAVGYLPLALSQVGAYLKATGTSPKDYLAEFKTEKARSEAILSEDNLPKGHGARETLIVGLIWEKTFEALKAQLPKEKYEASMGLLLSCSYLSGDGISKALLVEWLGERGAGAGNSESGVSLRALHGVLKPLIEYNLIQVSEEAIQMHRLLQAVVQAKGAAWPDAPTLRDWLQFFVKQLEERDATMADIARRKTYLAQLSVLEHEAAACWECSDRDESFLSVYVDFLSAQYHLYFDLGEAEGQRRVGERLVRCYEAKPESVEMALALHNLGNAHGDLGDVQRKKRLLERALAIEEQHYGGDHFGLAATLTNLGSAHGALGDVQTQKRLLERALAIDEQHYGGDHVKVAVTLMNLGNAHGALGDVQTKKRLLERALAIEEQHYGGDHVEVAITLVNLGNAHGALGDVQTQKRLLERALSIQEKHYGGDHVEVARTLTNLGNAHYTLRDIKMAKSYYECALAIKEKHYGGDHVEVARTLGNLGNAHGALGDVQTQKRLLERALAIKEQHYGTNHFEVAITLMNLGNAHGDLGDVQTQKRLLERALSIKEQHYGPDHVEVAITLTCLGNAHGDLGDVQTQKRLLERALAIQEQHYGPDHFQVAVTLMNLGNAHGALGDVQTQKRLLERALAIEEQHYGGDHFEVALTLMNLGCAHGALGDVQTKKRFLERALSIQEKHYGCDHFEVAATLGNLGNAHGDLGDVQTKKRLLERALAIKEQHYGGDHFEVALTLMNLGNAHGDLGDVQTKKRLLERALAIYEQHYGPDHSELLYPLVNLIDACLDLKADDEALKNRARLEAIYQASPYVDKPDLPLSRGIQRQKARIDTIKRGREVEERMRKKSEAEISIEGENAENVDSDKKESDEAVEVFQTAHFTHMSDVTSDQTGLRINANTFQQDEEEREIMVDSQANNLNGTIEAQAKKLASMDKKTRAGLGSVVSSSTSMMLNEGMAAEDKNDMDIETGRSERVLSASGTDSAMLFDTDEAAVTEKKHRSQNFLNRVKRNVKEQFGDHKKQKKDDNKGIYRFRLFENSERRANELAGEEGSTSAARGENTASSLNLQEKRSPETAEESTLPTPPSL